MIDLSAVVNSHHLATWVTIERTTVGYYDKSVYKHDEPIRFTGTRDLYGPATGSHAFAGGRPRERHVRLAVDHLSICIQRATRSTIT